MESSSHDLASPRCSHLQDAPTRRDVLIGAGLTVGALALPATYVRSGVVRVDHDNGS
jgi:hypothetical protein